MTLIKKHLDTVRNYFLIFLCICFTIFFQQSSVEAITNNWVYVPKSEFGRQAWDKNSYKKNQDGIIRVLSKYEPKGSEITKEILYTMAIDCPGNAFKDISVNEINNNSSEWNSPNGDQLIQDVIDQVCTFKN